jgi:hypothetical protein
MADADPMMSRIGAAMELSHRGEREEAREAFTQLWQNADAPLHRCAIAHAMADVQDDPREELAWDLRALDAVADVTDEDVAAAGMTSAAGAMRPSLHLNLGEDYRKLGELAAARRHLELGLAACDALPDDGYGRMIRGGLERLAERLETIA